MVTYGDHCSITNFRTKNYCDILRDVLNLSWSFKMVMYSTIFRWTLVGKHPCRPKSRSMQINTVEFTSKIGCDEDVLGLEGKAPLILNFGAR